MLIRLFILFLFSYNIVSAQYNFTIDKKVDCTTVKSQDRTGTCWSFATASFIESELMRMGKGQHDLSEMFVVKNIYKDKAYNYVMRQGKANFSQGSLSHDLIRVAAKHGMMPETVYSGMLNGEQKHDHSEMEAVLKGMLDGVLKQKRPSPKWKAAFNEVVDIYIGATPEQFNYQGKSYTPQSFAESTAINPDDYVSITSYTHHPFYKKFILEIPDNYSNGNYFNLPIHEVLAITKNAINQGFTIAWDGDVSEKGFSSKEGIAILPEDASSKDIFKKVLSEKKVDQALRQSTFENYSTTDDHLMHLMGTAKDQNGTSYFLIKNSWGEIGTHKGYLYMSEAYFKLKTVSIMVHKDAIPKDIAEKMAL